MKDKGFTLIEILAIIIILGIIMTIAIPAVAGNIDNSRKSGYVDSANSYVDEVRRQVASRKISLKRDGTIYVIPVDIIGLSGGSNRSPYGEWTKNNSEIKYVKKDNTIGTIAANSLSNAFVIAQYDTAKKDYIYYFGSIDETGHYIKPINIESLKINNIGMDTTYIKFMTYANITVSVNGTNTTITRMDFKTNLFAANTNFVMLFKDGEGRGKFIAP